MSSAINPNIVVDGLVLLLDAANPKSYPGSGTTWYDLSGNGNHGTLQNAPTYGSSVFTFNGTSQWVSISSLVMDELSDYTFTFIAKSSTTGDNRGFFGSGGGATGAFNFNHATTNNALIYNAGSNYQYFYAGSNQDDGTWHHWALGYNGTATGYNQSEASTLYIDNSAIGKGSGNANEVPVNWGAFRVGTDGGGSYWAGSLAFFTIHSGILTASELTQNYNALKARFGL